MSEPECPPEPDSLPPGTLFSLLEDRRRRVVLAALVDRDGSATVNDLTKELVDREFERPITEVPGDDVTRIYLSLYHVHVPKLAETPLVEFDGAREIVEPTDELHRAAPTLRTLAEADSVASLFDDE